jgi:hypothetical protein
LFGGCLLTVGLVHGALQQSPWNVVMFGIDFSRNLTLARASESRTRMLDINTGLMKPLPFRYEDPYTGTVAADQSRTLMMVDSSQNDGRTGSDLAIIYRDDPQAQQLLTDYPGYDGEPEGTADLRRIVFISDRDGSFDVYLLILDENDTPVSVRRITASEEVEKDPQWLSREQYHEYFYEHNAGAIYIVIDVTNPGWVRP